MGEKTKKIDLSAKLIINFVVPTTISEDDLNSWTHGGETMQREISNKILEHLGLRDMEYVVTEKMQDVFLNMMGEQFKVKNALFEIIGTVSKKLTCPDCGYIPENQEFKYCGKCRAELVKR